MKKTVLAGSLANCQYKILQEGPAQFTWIVIKNGNVVSRPGEHRCPGGKLLFEDSAEDAEINAILDIEDFFGDYPEVE